MDMFTTILTSKSKICTDEAALANYSEWEIEREKERKRERNTRRREEKEEWFGRNAQRKILYYILLVKILLR